DPPSLRLGIQVKALGSAERLQRLKVVRLNAKSSFASATNINDITFSWGWEPRIAFRFEEVLPDDRLQPVINLLKRGDKTSEDLYRKILANAKAQLTLDSNLDQRYEQET